MDVGIVVVEKVYGVILEFWVIIFCFYENVVVVLLIDFNLGVEEFC